jgi:hypothetical protein
MVQGIDSNRTSIIHMSFPLSLRLYAQDCSVLYNNAALLKYLYHANTDIFEFRIGTIPVSPITARSESAKRFDNRKEKSREILDR